MFRKLGSVVRATKYQYYFSTVPSQHVNFPIEKISNSIKVKPTRLEVALDKNENLYKTNIDQWRRFFETLTNQGFQRDTCLSMITMHPQLLNMRENELIKSLENWRNCQFGETNVCQLLSTHPEFFNIPAQEIDSRVSDLLTIIPSRNKVKKLIEQNPNIMFMKWSNIIQTLEYIQSIMRVEIPEIYKSGALQMPLHDLKCRHIFLCRLGLYKPRNPKASPLDPCTNAKLNEITVKDDAFFATEVAMVTLEEFRVFQELYEQELGRINNDSDDEVFSEDEDDEIWNKR